MTLDLSITNTALMSCAFEGCTNLARYITIDGRYACATCPVQHKIDAVKITAVPELLKAVRALVQWGEGDPDFESDWSKTFNLIVGKDASKT